MLKCLKVFLPAPDRQALQDFYDLLRLTKRYGYNAVMLELGGAMPYASHPEINEGWLEYAAFMREYPGKALGIQRSCPWAKNSIHIDNGLGQVLTPDHIADIVNFCRGLALEIIPEVPTLSHCDYLLTRHPELAERHDDPFPDTACPNHPDYFPLICDILRDVIDAFHPKRINIGHDELYSVGLCPRCHQTPPHQLFADEINRTNRFLRQFGVHTMLWGEKLLNSHYLDGTPIGGAGAPAKANCEAIPPLYPCGELLDKDIVCLHWYWGIDRNFDTRYQDLGLDYCFGNFEPQTMPDFAKRIAAPHCLGFVVSNWGTMDLLSMQRNGVLYSLIYAALATNGSVPPDDFNTLHKQTSEELFKLFNSLQENTFEIVHTTHTHLEYSYFYDGYYLNNQDYFMGEHIYADDAGKQYRFPVYFGSNISNDHLHPARRYLKNSPVDSFAMDMQLIEATGTSLPCIDTNTNKIFYRILVKHPCPGNALHYVRFEPASVFIPEVRVLGQDPPKSQRLKSFIAPEE